MTAQMADTLIVDGAQLPLFTNPLDSYISDRHQGWPFVSTSTANWRGYIARWEIREGRLLLVGLQGWMGKRAIDAGSPLEIRLTDNRREMPDEWLGHLEGGPDDVLANLNGPDVALGVLFPGAGESVFATWFTGVLRVPEGECVHSAHMGYESTYEHELRITIDRGCVVGAERVQTGEAFRRKMEELAARREVSLPARADEDGWMTCPHCGVRFTTRDHARWDGERHRSCGGRIALDPTRCD